MQKKNEESVVRDAIQYWIGFNDALKWAQKTSKEDLDKKIVESDEMIEVYRERLFLYKKATLRNKKRKNARRNKRD